MFLKNMAHLMIRLYYDMWVDEGDYGTEQKEVYYKYKENEAVVLEGSRISKSEKLKFKLFSLSPFVFCVTHKIHLSLIKVDN